MPERLQPTITLQWYKSAGHDPQTIDPHRDKRARRLNETVTHSHLLSPFSAGGGLQPILRLRQKKQARKPGSLRGPLFGPRRRFLRGGGSTSDGESLALVRDDVLGVVEPGDPVSWMKVRFCIKLSSPSSVIGVSGGVLSPGTGSVGVGKVYCEGDVWVLGLVGESSFSLTSPRALARLLDCENAFVGMLMEGRRQSSPSMIGYGWAYARGSCAGAYCPCGA